ncbi:DUF4442 domain-containing protein [Nostoc sp. CHAB 5834]|nr:DUF4442 domain-containing protein [Nostoc sp. CHAB 5834]
MFDIIKAQLAATLPFVATTGVEVIEVAAGRAVCALEQRPEVGNHINSIHAGALFTLGETASGAAMSGTFAMQLLSVRPVATGATIRYVKVAKGRVVAEAQVRGSTEDLAAELERDAKTAFTIDVTLVNAETETVATMTVDWLVAKRRDA